MPSSTTPVGGSPRSQAYVDIGSGEHGVRTERSEPRTDAAEAAPSRGQSQIAENITKLNPGATAGAAGNLPKTEFDTVADSIKTSCDRAASMMKDLTQLAAQKGRRNQTSSPGKQKIMAKSIQSAYPMAGAAAFAAFGVMLLAAGPFGALTGIAIAYGAYSIYSALKQHQEAQMDTQNQQGSEGGGGGEHGSGNMNQSPRPMSSRAPIREPESTPSDGVPKSTVIKKQATVLEGGDSTDLDGKEDSYEEEDDDVAQNQPRSTTVTGASNANRPQPAVGTRAVNLHPEPAPVTEEAEPIGSAHHTVPAQQTGTEPAPANAAPSSAAASSSTQANTSTERTDAPTTHDGTSPASAAASREIAQTANATAGASPTAAQPQRQPAT